MKPPPPTPMKRERFRALLESYGSRVSHWPLDVRSAAQAFVATTPEAATWLAEQQELDVWLDSASTIEPSPALLRAVAEIPIRHPARTWWSKWNPRSALAALGAAAVLGVLAGLATPDQLFDDGDTITDDEYTMTWNSDVPDEVLP